MRSVNSVCPEGGAELTWQALADRHEPKNAVDQQTLMTEFVCFYAGEWSKDPMVLTLELQRMQTRLKTMGATVSVNMVIGHILN
jgi:hypothetical protein